MFPSAQLLSPDQVQIRGDVLRRMMRNFDRLEQSDYESPAVYKNTENNQQWPGDTPGRTILALANLAQWTRRTPRFLDDLVRQLPAHLNARGYMGQVMTDVIDEQQQSGHGWLLSGLLAYTSLTRDPRAKSIADDIARNLMLPVRGRLHTYPIRPDERKTEGSYSGTRAGERSGWSLSTDIGCAFIMLEGLVPWYEQTRDPDGAELINEAAQAFDAIDLIGASAQLHASLTAARSFLRFHNSHPREQLLKLAQRVYGQFRDLAMTANYASFNWFNRGNTWTEPCAVVDAFILAFELWRKTGQPQYLEDAHHIYFNALGYAQKPHGGFGCDNCVGADGLALHNKVYDVSWCCNMRGAVGLSYAAQICCLQNEDQVVFPFYSDGTFELRFADGAVRLNATTDYPRGGRVTLVVEHSATTSEKQLIFHMPSWASTWQLHMSGQPRRADEVKQGMLQLRAVLTPGTRIELSFPVDRRVEDPSKASPSDRITYRHGPLILGVAYSGDESFELAALQAINDVIDLREEQAKSERRRVLFKRPMD